MEIIELHSVPPESIDVKTLYEVFSWGREALGEYIYFAEVDRDGLKEDKTGDLTKAAYYADVEVSFEGDTLSVTKDTIFRSSHYLKLPSIDSIGLATPHELFQKPFGGEEFLINSGADHCFIMRAVSWSKTVVFIKLLIEGDRTTTIQVASEGNKLKIKDMYERAEQLIETYSSIPMNRFSGAIRE